MNLHGYWLELTANAMIGSERKPLPMREGDDALSQLTRMLPSGDSARILLSAAALTAQARRAGAEPLRIASDAGVLGAAPAAAETQPIVPPAAARRLQSLLEGNHEGLLPEWLAAAGQRGFRVPVEALPALLELGVKDKEIRPALVGVIGRRGEWLARWEKRWGYLFGSLGGSNPTRDQTLWETGAKTERIALLARLRNVDPDRGCALVASTWSSDSAQERIRFLELMNVGLSQNDEPFLEERALGGRSLVAARAAAALLAQLPNSRWVARMTSRANECVKIDPRASGFALKIEPPSACPADWQRDGVAPKSEVHKMGDKAFWLRELVSAVPPTHWEHALKSTPKEIIKAIGATKWDDAVTDGLSIAIRRFRATDWADAFLDRFLNNFQKDQPWDQIQHLLPEIGAARIQDLFLKAMDARKITAAHGDVFRIMIDRCPKPMPESFALAISRCICEHIREYEKKTNRMYELHYNYPASLQHFGRMLPLSLLDVVVQDWSADAAAREIAPAVYDGFLDFLRYRRDMLRELAQ